MKMLRKLRLGACMLGGAAVLLAGCGDGKPANSAVPSDSAKPAASAAAIPSNGKEAVSGIGFGADETVVAPGASRQLSLFGKTGKTDKLDVTGNAGVQWSSGSPDIVRVDAHGSVQAGPKAVTGSAAKITAAYKGFTAELTVKIKYSLADTVTVSGGKAFVNNPDDLAVVVNKKRALPETYAPKDLTEPKVPFSFSGKNEKRTLRKDAAAALEKLFQLAGKDGFKLYGVSGYRSYATQKAIYDNNVKTQGKAEADKVSAQPGQSEHQSGQAIDVSSASANFGLEESFGATAEGKWLAAHAHEAGFIIRYPLGKESVTGYAYEPWHIRYVGEEIAKEIHEKGWTLEDYFQEAVPVSK